ncbi:MAG: N-6 DNA methylase [Rickettsiales bacterium]|nr:N-6 DNA methylase [Rickettsiales bacterium]
MKNEQPIIHNSNFSSKFLQDEDLTAKAIQYNKLLGKYSVPETLRNTLISAILVSLQDDNFIDNFDQYKKNIDLVKTMLRACLNILNKNNITDQRKDIILREYSNILNNQKLISTSIRDRDTKTIVPNVILKNLIGDLKNTILPFVKENDFDILGRFYTEFTRSAGRDNKTGLVLTPVHITDLFCELADLRSDDVVYDPCCGTGGFLVSAMKYMLDKSANDIKTRNKIKQDRLIGVEVRADMFTHACSNMMIRGDGRTNIFNGDCFDESIINRVKSYKPNKGFLNPPYNVGSDGQLEFVENTLECLVKGGKCVAICQMSAAIRQDRKTIEVRERLLKNHSLEAVFSMPDRLFYPTGVITSILVFTAHIPHETHKKVFFGYFKDDGYVVKIRKGRLDDGSWQSKRKHMLSLYSNNKQESGLSVVKSITAQDEWCAEAYMETDYSKLTEADFVRTIKNYIVFQFLNSSDG